MHETIIILQPTHIFLVPPLMLFVARCPDITAEDMSNLKLVVSGAAPLSRQVMDEFLQKAPSRMIFKSG
jgi:4-coumarate--CoA ligase